MISFEVPFVYQSHSYIAVVDREKQIPDIISVQQPNDLHLPRVFTLESKTLFGAPLFKNRQDLASEIKHSIINYSKSHFEDA